MQRVDADFARVIPFRVDDEALAKILVNEIGCVHIRCNSHYFCFVQTSNQFNIEL